MHGIVRQIKMGSMDLFTGMDNRLDESASLSEIPCPIECVNTSLHFNIK